MKKLFTLLFALVASAGTIFAQSGKCGENLTWTLDTETGILTISGTGEMMNYSTSQKPSAGLYWGPWWNISFTSVVISEGVTSIGDWAFYNCYGLSIVTLPNSLISIGKYAFCNCTGLTSVVIPNSVTTIEDHAFHGCSSMTSITIPNSVTSIKYGTFYQCGLTSITIPNSVTNIETYAFLNCYSLTDLIIGDSVKKIGSDAFYDCHLTTVVWQAKHCDDLTSAPFPYSVTSFNFGTEVEYIPTYLCSNLSNVKNIILPCSVNGIGDSAFHPSTIITRNCDIVAKTELSMNLCEGEKLSWHDTYITSVKPSDSGDYEYKTKTVLYDDSIVTLHLTVIPTCYTQLKDTILCYEDDLILDDIKCNFKKLTDKQQTWTYTLKTIAGCDSVISISVLWRKPEITLPDTTLCYKDDLILDEIKCPLTKKANIKQTWSYTLQTIDGCDSTITISVVWRKLPDFTITTRHEFDTPNSGSISYKKADTNYSGKYYYTLNGEKNASLYNLSAGTYQLVFYSEDNCDDSYSKTIQINKYGMNVNNQYYLFDEKNHTATLTYRGTSYSDYSGEYSGNITIPKTITFEGEEYQVTGINSSTFSGCSNIKSITMESETPISISSIGLSYSCIIYVPYGSLNAYKASPNWKDYNLHVINPSHATLTSGATSTCITFGDADEQKHIVSCGIEEGKVSDGYILEYIGLEPESEYKDVPFVVNTKEGDQDIIYCSFTTSALSITTQPSKPVSEKVAILLAETNMADIETSCGFEWKRNDAPEDMAPNKVICPVANGIMAGRLKNLKDDVYYKYRAFYESAAGNMYYGDWQYIFTGDVMVEFDPILYTYAASLIKEHEATLKGYALAGSTDFTEQGFEYWAESRAGKASAPRRQKETLGEHYTVTASGISMKTTLTNLDEGTVYRYRTYAKIGEQILYGTEMTFTTQGEYVEESPTSVEIFQQEPDNRARKILRNGQVLIQRGDKLYTLTGQEVK